ncbi:MAG: twin-arginine translocation signal domain-containing protein [Dehalococcoidales bacterium]|nr:twin-arginine translocation signal domain-containing protein [Dehalococcoidales bacterium]
MKDNEYKRFAFSSEKGITRRQFIKDVSVLAGGLTLATFLGGCGDGDETKTTTTASDPGTKTGQTSNTTTSKTTTTTSNTGTITNTATGNGQHLYTATQETLPSTELIPGCTTYVALDRLYSFDHIWVKKLEGNKVLIGITEKCLLLIGFVDSTNPFSLPLVGEKLKKDSPFGYMDGKKMYVEFMSPVSGTVLDVHPEAFYRVAQLSGSVFYNEGWLLLAEVDDMSDLDELLNPFQYGKYQIPQDYVLGSQANEALFLDA